MVLVHGVVQPEEAVESERGLLSEQVEFSSAGCEGKAASVEEPGIIDKRTGSSGFIKLPSAVTYVRQGEYHQVSKRYQVH